MTTESGLTKLVVAKAMLEHSPLAALRNEAKTPLWSQVYRGFRPQALTRTSFVRFAHVFARNSELLTSLAEAFLVAHGATWTGSLQERFLKTAEDAPLADDVLEMCKALSSLDLLTLPDEKSPAVVVPESDDTDESSTSAHQEEPLVASFVTNAEPLDWRFPDDHIAEIQEAVTLFERSLAAFIQRQLRGLHGDAWLRRGCGPWRKEWSERARARQEPSLQPSTLLGYAFLGEYRDIIASGTNWSGFRAYFPDKEWLVRTFSFVEPLRSAGMHPGERELNLLDQTAPLKAMVDIAACYHRGTADRIRELFDAALNFIGDEDDNEVSIGSVILSNLGEFSDVGLVGRESELSEIKSFWEDEFSRIISITGPGGVGKTALLEQFIYNHLSERIPRGQRPYPEAVVYLTAKDNYLRYMKRAPDSRQFRTARRVFEATLETLGGSVSEDTDTATLRRQVLGLAKDTSILFALDNLETLPAEEHEEIRHFLDDLHHPSKAILTTRVDRRIGHNLNLHGLPAESARTLLTRRLGEHGILVRPEEERFLDEIIEYTGALPLALVYCTNAIQNGRTIPETSEAIRGQRFINLLHFSFDSSLDELEGTKLKILVFLAMSRHSRTRGEMLSLSRDEDDLDESLALLRDMSFVRPMWEEQKQNRFAIDNSMLKDYVLERAEHVLPPADRRTVMEKAKVQPAQVTSENVSIEVERAITAAKRAPTWEDALSLLETARRKWGDDGRLLAQSGYYHYRLESRQLARVFMEAAITKGYEAAENYGYLALVLFYEKEYDESLRRAETALALKRAFPQADQVAGQCHVAIAERDRLLHDSGWTRRHLDEGIKHLERSIIAEDTRPSDERHNLRARQTIERAERLLATLG